MEYEDRRTIATPEGVQLALPLANIGSRFLALLLDDIVAGTLLTVALLVAAFGIGGLASVIVSVFSLLVFFVGYHVVFEVWGGGRTIGKRAAGLRVVTVNGAPVGLRRSLIRNIIRILEGAALLYIPAIISVIASRNNQRLGDLAGGTIVVREPKAIEFGGQVRPVEPQRYASWDVTGVGDAETTAVRAFLERRAGLNPGPRRQLAATLAGRLRPQVAGVRPGLADEEFLELLAAAKARGNMREHLENRQYPA